MSGHTPGPWRWEFNKKHKEVKLCGGVPLFDLTVMDFARWGLDGAVPLLREDEPGMNIMHRLCDQQEWIKPFVGREHHADWCAEVTHPDMRLIAAAPDLLEALEKIIEMNVDYAMHKYGDILHAESMSCVKVARAAIAKAKGETNA